jgi:hypothetical protein
LAWSLARLSGLGSADFIPTIQCRHWQAGPL